MCWNIEAEISCLLLIWGFQLTEGSTSIDEGQLCEP